ncbi:hypothetical protein PF011_g9586 [Phytophthora fragariae]|uniref:Uncharacterized protein n=1 Tax=Phytophthora fragariae TaxID=53985 RepID=A0A6A3L541_9STRA|nr:hypothetical protein PF011_g9586 [Phytophthora fragariae]
MTINADLSVQRKDQKLAMVVKKSIVAEMVEDFPHDAADAELVRALTVYQAK